MWHKAKSSSHQVTVACLKATGNGNDERQHVTLQFALKLIDSS